MAQRRAWVPSGPVVLACPRRLHRPVPSRAGFAAIPRPVPALRCRPASRVAEGAAGNGRPRFRSGISHGRNSIAGGFRRADPGWMDLKEAAQVWQTDGFVILPGFIPADELKSAVDELDVLFPSAEGFH